jgi:hypothetical protein
MKTKYSSRPGLRKMTPNGAKRIFVFSMVAFAGVATLADAAKPQPKLRKELGKDPETYVELTPAGEQLRAKYEARHLALKTELQKELPQVDPAKQKALLDALAAQKQADFALRKAERDFRRGYQNNVGAVQFLEQRLAETPKRIADAKAVMKAAQAMPDDHPDKALAMEEAVKMENEAAILKDIPKKLADAKAKVAASMPKKAELQAKVDAAVKALAEAKAKTQQARKALGVDALLASGKLDAKLAQFTVLQEGTPYWLAVYAQQGAKQEQNIEHLLGNPELAIQMLVADGPVWEKFGPAVEIYQAIQATSPKAKEGLFQQLAMAVSLAHAVPLIQENPEVMAKNVQYVDPVKRYLSYEKAYLAGELDPAFKQLDAWSLRMAVDGHEPDETNAWGRQMLRNYRPDLVTLEDYDWRYVRSVDTEVNYTSAFQKLGWDKPELQRFQNILAVGGICGRRAFFGGFILRSFGIPTMERPEPGHASLVHWTPHGWVPCLGGPWGSGNRVQLYRYQSDLDFLASTQARENEEAFMKVKRAQWIGGVYGEAPQYGYTDRLKAGDYEKYIARSLDQVQVPGFWHAVSAVTQDQIIAGLQAKVRSAVGEDLGESNEALLKAKIDQVEIPAAERKITVDAKGVIHIPAAACCEPTNNTEIIRFMPSNLGGMQLHYSRKPVSDTFTYTFDAPKAGKYHLTARLVAPAPKQYLFLNVNDAKERVEIALPYTIGNWGQLEPVAIELAQGKNTLTFSRGHFYIRGVAIRDFTLSPAK